MDMPDAAGWRQPARLPRIAIGGLLHETNTFAPGFTTIEAFSERVLLRGGDLIDAGAGTDSALGGVIDAVAGRATLVPTLFASAMPGGPVADATLKGLAGDLLDRLRRAQARYPRLAGVVLLLHGAMVTESDADAEGTLLRRAREVVGAACPIVALLDSHANISPVMVATADFIVAYRSYPHVDLRARGAEAMRACLDLVEGSGKPVVTHRKLPLLMPLVAQSTAPESPLKPVLDLADAWREHPDIASVSIVPGFPFADVPDAGASVLVYARDQEGAGELAATAARELAARWWSLRDRFEIEATPLSQLPSSLPGVTVLADIADNPGAGGPSDGTHILRHAIAAGWQDAAFATIVDPEAVATCYDAGTAATIDLAIGGKATPLSGEPARAEWRVAHLGDGVFANEGPMANGGITRLGRTATVRHGGISVILCERRAQALDPSVFRAGGIVPEQCRWLVVKSSVHYRASFAPLATSMIDIETQGLSASRLRDLPYNRVPRPIAPLDAAPDALAPATTGESLHA